MTTLPIQSYVAPSPAYAYNGTCDGCHTTIWGAAFVCPKGEYHLDCAIEIGYLCSECLKDECECEEEAA